MLSVVCGLDSAVWNCPYQSKIRYCQSWFTGDRSAANRVPIMNDIYQGKEMPSKLDISMPQS